MVCECRGAARALVLLARDLESTYPELAAFEPGADWQLIAELGAIRVEVGPHSRWAGPAEVTNFLRTILDDERLEALRAAWLPLDADPRQHTIELIHAQPLLELVPQMTSPLLSILRKRQLETWFQPIFRARQLELWGYECLMRARGDDGELINPGKLLQWARDERLTFMLDRVARETHLITAGRAGLAERAQLLINFMPTAVYQPEFCLRTTLAAANRYEIAPERITFEVVESERVHDREHLNAILGYYRRQGFGVALDDVGNGHAGLIMLADVDPDLIKIDRYLVQRAPDSSIHRRICATLTELGRERGKLVLAEGIETPREKEVMDRLGVDLYQGFLFAKPNPVPATEPETTLARIA